MLRDPRSDQREQEHRHGHAQPEDELAVPQREMDRLLPAAHPLGGSGRRQLLAGGSRAGDGRGGHDPPPCIPIRVRGSTTM